MQSAIPAKRKPGPKPKPHGFQPKEVFPYLCRGCHRRVCLSPCVIRRGAAGQAQANHHRRHMTPSELALVGAKARGMYDEAAKERMSAGGKAAGKGRPQQGVEGLPPPIDSGKSRDAAGKAVGVSGKRTPPGRESGPWAWVLLAAVQALFPRAARGRGGDGLST